MRQRGLLFTVMAFFMILAILSLNAVIREGFRESKSIGELSALSAVASKFRNIERIAVELSEGGKLKEVNERVLPFNYDLNADQNFLIVQQQMPLKSVVWNEFFNVMNLLEVFLEDGNRGNVFDGLAVSIATAKNAAWGGASEELHFLVEPFCYELALRQNTSLFRESGSVKCSQQFQNSFVKRFDLNIAIMNSNEDFNALHCNGTTQCPQEPFQEDPPSGYPYYRIEILDENCGNCVLPQKVVSQHFNPAQDFNVVVSCVGANCVSSPIIISSHELDFNVFHESSYRLAVTAKTTFSERASGFYFLDFNVSVAHFDVNASKNNLGGFA